MSIDRTTERRINTAVIVFISRHVASMGSHKYIVERCNHINIVLQKEGVPVEIMYEKILPWSNRSTTVTKSLIENRSWLHLIFLIF